MRRTLMVLTVPREHATQTSTSCSPLRAPQSGQGRAERPGTSKHFGVRTSNSCRGLAPFRLFADRVGDDMAERPQPQPDGRDPLWRETLWSLGLLMAAAFLVFLIAETAPR